MEKVRRETLRSRGHDGNGEDGEELKGRRCGDESTNEEQGTGVGEKGEKVKRNYENGDCKKREK